MTNPRINQLEESIKELSTRVINGDMLNKQEQDRLQHYAQEYYRETGDYYRVKWQR